MTYIGILNRMSALGDALSLNLSAKAMSETVLMRAHYSKGVSEWSAMCEQVGKDVPRKEGESDEAYEKRLNELLVPKSKEEVTLADRRYSNEAFEDLCRAAIEAGEITSSVFRDSDNKPGKVPAVMWLEFVAANLVNED